MSVDLFPDSKRAIDELQHGPHYPGKEFIAGGATFAEVYAMAARLRLALAEVDNGAAVCLATENKAVIAAALLASLAGGPRLLLPYALSARALAQMQQTTGFSAAIADVPGGFSTGVQVLCPREIQGQWTNQPSAIPVKADKQAASAVLLYIFTGGSTGKPQLFAKTKENIFGEAFFLASRYRVVETDCILATIPPYHIYGLLFSVVLPLVSSATVVGDTPSFPGDIARVIRQHKVTLLAGVPAHYRVLRDARLAATLRLAFSSAGMLDAVDNHEFCRTNSKGVVEVYGSTETGGIATRNRSLGEEHFTAFPTLDWKIIDSRLAVRSPYISPDLPLDADGFFLAGDRVQAQGAQYFSLLGRADTITKVGGKRVDLEEIRLLINNAAGVSDCVVMALPDFGGRENQIGVLIEGSAINIESLKKTLIDSLEPYALPRRIRTVDHIPVHNNGKYDGPAIIRLLGDE